MKCKRKSHDVDLNSFAEDFMIYYIMILTSRSVFTVFPYSSSLRLESVALTLNEVDQIYCRKVFDKKKTANTHGIIYCFTRD